MFSKTVISPLIYIFSQRKKDKSSGKLFPLKYNLVIFVSLIVFELWQFKEAILSCKGEQSKPIVI